MSNFFRKVERNQLRKRKLLKCQQAREEDKKRRKEKREAKAK